MNKLNLKFFWTFLKEVVEELESEIYRWILYERSIWFSDLILDYDEVLGDDDGYPDWLAVQWWEDETGDMDLLILLSKFGEELNSSNTSEN